MKKIPTIIALCTFAALPVGAVVAGSLSACKADTIVRAESEKEETKTIELTITGMT